MKVTICVCGGGNMDMFNTIVGIIGVAIGVAGFIVGIVSLKNTTLIKREQAREIEAAHDSAIYNSDMPRTATIERPNPEGVGIVLLQFENVNDLLDYMREHPNEKVITTKYRGKGPYNKVEAMKI